MAKLALPKESYANLLKAERMLHDLLPEFDKAEECGVECQELRTANQQMLQRIEAIKRNYGPTIGRTE